MESGQEEGIPRISLLGGSIGGLCALFLLGVCLIWLLDDIKILNAYTILVETLVFVFLMIFGDISNNAPDNWKKRLDCAGWAKVALFIIVSVIPAYVQHLVTNIQQLLNIEGEDTPLVFSCLLRLYTVDVKYSGDLLVFVLFLVGMLCAALTAHKLKVFTISNTGIRERGFSGAWAFVVSIIAGVMCAVYFFLNHLIENKVADCSNVYQRPEKFLICFLVVLLYLGAVMLCTRIYSVRVLIPFLEKGQTAGHDETKSIYNQLLLLIVFILVSILAIYYWDSLSEKPILLVLFGLFVCFVILRLLSAVIHWKNYYPHILLVLIAAICALAVTYLAMVYLHNRSSDDLKEIPLSPETIEYLDQFKTN